MRAVAAAVFAAGFTCPALAQSVTHSDEIVVTAPLEGAQFESLQGAAVLSRDDIAETLNGSLGDTLDAVPGVASTFYGAGASRPIIRGLGDDRIRVLANGVGAIDAASASPDHAVSADALASQRIEILRGAAALAYGGNAVGGVVNIIDQSIPTRAPDGAFDGEALLGVTSVNGGGEAQAGVTFSGPVLFRLDAAVRDTGDFNIPGFADASGAGVSGHAPNSWTQLRSLNGGASLVRDWGFTGVAVRRYETQYGLAPEDPSSEIGGHIELEQTRVETRGERRFSGPFTALDWAAQYSDYQHTEFEEDGAAGTVFTNEGYEARAELHNRFGALSGATGAQISDVDFAAVGDEAFLEPTSTRDLGLFTVQRLDLGAWGFEGGLRIERRDLDHRTLGERSFEPVSFSLGAFVEPAQNWFVAVTAARTERAPTAVELFANGPHLATGSFEVGDPSLDIETAQSVEASLRYRTDDLSFELNLYRIQFDGYVALIDTGLLEPFDGDFLPRFQFTQRDATFEGGELTASAQLFDLGAMRIGGDVALDLVRASFDSGGALPRIPPRTATLGLTAESELVSGRIEMVDVADQERVDTFETPTDGYREFNARLTFRPREGIAIILDGRNLTNQEERVHASFLRDVLPRPGRGVRLAISTEF